MRPLALCAVTHDDHARHVVTIARRLTALGDFRVSYAYVCALPITETLRLELRDGTVHTAMPRLGAPSAVDAYEAWSAGARALHDAGLTEDGEAFVAGGSASAELRRLADEQAATLVVVGLSRPRWPLSRAVGVPARLSRTAPCPVLIVAKDMSYDGGGAVICGIERADRHGLDLGARAAQLACVLDRQLVLAHVIAGSAGEPSRRTRHDARAMLNQVASRSGARDVEVAVLQGEVISELDRVARGRPADLLVVGSGRQRALRHVVDRSVSAQLARSATRPLVVVPHRLASPA